MSVHRVAPLRPVRPASGLLPALLVLVSLVPWTPCLAEQQTHRNLFFLHHSTGRYLLEEGNVRSDLMSYNRANGTAFVLWDHDYNYLGLMAPSGYYVGHDYGIPNDNTDPDGLHYLWTTANSARDSILANHEVIAFKSCYPACAIQGLAQLRSYFTWYLEMRDVFDQYPDKIFVVMSPPPLHRLSTNLAQADLARTFANWLGSDTFLLGHTNVLFFDFFDLLAHPDDGSEQRNMLRYEYELSHYNGDSHPNLLANQTVGPLFCQFLIEAGLGVVAGLEADLPPVGPRLEPNYPNPFNPLTRIGYRLSDPAAVSLRVFDLQGYLIRTLTDGWQEAGSHEVIWDGTDRNGQPAASGIYIYSLEAGSRTVTRKMVLSK